MKVEIGDKITALGYTFEIARIMYQDYYQGYWDVEFLDPHGGYHHWIWRVYDNSACTSCLLERYRNVVRGLRCCTL